MLTRTRPQRRIYKIGSFLQREEKIRQESQLSAQAREVNLKRDIERDREIHTQRQKIAENEDAQQQLSQLQREEPQNLDFKYMIELKEFMEQRAERRRLYQAKKNEAQLAEFWEQRAQARREYRAAKAQGEGAVQTIDRQ
jgi:hypothetical protein